MNKFVTIVAEQNGQVATGEGKTLNEALQHLASQNADLRRVAILDAKEHKRASVGKDWQTSKIRKDTVNKAIRDMTTPKKNPAKKKAATRKKAAPKKATARKKTYTRKKNPSGQGYHVAVHLNAGSTPSGTPQGLFLVFNRQGRILAAINEGYRGDAAIVDAGFKKDGLVLGTFQISKSQYKELLKAYPSTAKK